MNAIMGYLKAHAHPNVFVGLWWQKVSLSSTNGMVSPSDRQMGRGCSRYGKNNRCATSPNSG